MFPKGSRFLYQLCFRREEKRKEGRKEEREVGRATARDTLSKLLNRHYIESFEIANILPLLSTNRQSDNI